MSENMTEVPQPFIEWADAKFPEYITKPVA